MDGPQPIKFVLPCFYGLTFQIEQNRDHNAPVLAEASRFTQGKGNFSTMFQLDLCILKYNIIIKDEIIPDSKKKSINTS